MSRWVSLALALAGASLLASACGASSSPVAASARSMSAASPATSPQERALAFARCMRTHGVPDFPDPDAQGDFQSVRPGEPKQTVNAANETCKHLLSSGETATPQQQQQKLEFGVKVAECLRAHGYPGFPDPTRLGSESLPPGVDVSSPRFQTTETSCETDARKALGLP